VLKVIEGAAVSNSVKIVARTLLGCVVLVSACATLPQASTDAKRIARFEIHAEALRARLHIPGMSAVIVKDQKVLWTKGFGDADVENHVAATPDTVYSIASETKPIAATLVMQLVEHGELDLDEPVSHFSSDFKDDSVKIKHLLSHTSGGSVPGEHYAYDGERYDYLTAVIEKKTGKALRDVMVQTILDPLGMSSSVPGPNVLDDKDKWIAVLGKDHVERYTKNLTRQSQPYTLYGDSEIVHVAYPPNFFGAAAGLLSTVVDLAKFDIAIDRHVLLKKATQEKAWTAFVSNSGQRLPYGLGWFVSDYEGTRLIWHGGNWGSGFSAIYVKVPSMNVSLILLGNSEALNGHLYAVGEAITNNAFACAFLREFAFSDAQATDCDRTSEMAVAKWLDERRAQAHVTVRVEPKILDAYVGQYNFETFDRTITVQKESDKLFVDIPRGGKSELFAASESTFFIKIRALDMTFVKDAGHITHVDVVENGAHLRANRIK